jgi:ABC-type multidrug transport system fused ATPase/permease subunit
MNVAERDAARAVAVEHPQSAAAGAATPVQSRKLRPLIALMPYITCYRWRALAALLALLIAAVTTLVVPVAVRRMIDFGFSRESASLIDSYFDDMIATPQWSPEQRDKQERVRQALLTSPLLTSVELGHGSGVILSTRHA